MNPDSLHRLKIQPQARRRPQRPIWLIFVGVAVITTFAVYRAWPRASDQQRILVGKSSTASNPPAASGGAQPVSQVAPQAAPAGERRVSGSLLTVSGYIVNRERIELSPRFLGTVKWIGVRKGDAVTNGQVVVLLDDAEYRARLRETEARHASAQVAVEKARLDLRRAEALVANRVEMQKVLDDARLQVQAAQASLQEVEGQLDLVRTYLEWCTIRSPIDGVVLEKLVDPNELVVPQSFGGGRGPSTALIALADPRTLQVEIDLNEADLPKVLLNQRCQVSPEAYPNRVYEGYVAEIAPEANRQKGTLQVKVQVVEPDRFLTPELSAKVDFLQGDPRP